MKLIGLILIITGFLGLPADGSKPIDEQKLFMSTWLIMTGIILDIEANAQVDTTDQTIEVME